MKYESTILALITYILLSENTETKFTHLQIYSKPKFTRNQIYP